MTPENEKYFSALYKRLRKARPVPVVSVAIGDWKPVPKMCHENVDRYTANQPALNAVRGWIIDGTDGNEGYLLVAHSIVEEGGYLYDITPADGLPVNPSAPRRFVEHIGTEKAFSDMLPEFTQHWVFAP
jgi:hypothetical protein